MLKKILQMFTPTNEPKKVLTDAYPKMTSLECNLLDKKLRSHIIKKDTLTKEDTLNYVKTILSSSNISKYKIDDNCSKIATSYLSNLKQWTFQQNLFCFFAFILTLAWMFVQLIEQLTNIAWLNSHCFQSILYLSSLVLFLFLDKFNSLHPLKKFSIFLKALNQYAPSITLITTFLFHFLLALNLDKTITIIIMILFFILPIVVIYKTLALLITD